MRVRVLCLALPFPPLSLCIAEYTRKKNLDFLLLLVATPNRIVPFYFYFLSAERSQRRVLFNTQACSAGPDLDKNPPTLAAKEGLPLESSLMPYKSMMTQMDQQ